MPFILWSLSSIYIPNTRKLKKTVTPTRETVAGAEELLTYGSNQTTPSTTNTGTMRLPTLTPRRAQWPRRPGSLRGLGNADDPRGER